MIVISNPVPIPKEIAIINELFKQGMDIFHIRKPAYSTQQLQSFIAAINPDYHPKLVLHQYYDLAAIYDIRRIHSTYKNSQAFKKYADNIQKREEWVFSIATHSITEFNNLEDNFEYAFLSPIYESVSKPGYKPKGSMIESLTQRTNFNTGLIALGGISSSNYIETLDLDFDDIAVLGAIWNTDNPVNEFKHLLSKKR